MLLKLVSPWGMPLQRATPGSAGFDILSNEYVEIRDGQQKLIRTGIFTEFSDEFVAIIKEKSGLANKGISIKAGVIDGDYRGEWGIIVRYNKPQDYDPPLWTFNVGDKVAQVLFINNWAHQISFELVGSIEHLAKSQRGDGGFGSTGK